MVARPAQPDQPTPVVDDERDPLETLRPPEPLERLDVALPGPRRVGLGVTETGQVRGDRVEAGGGQHGQHLAPHVRGLGIAVDEQHGGVAAGARLSVLKLGHRSADAIRAPHPGSTMGYMKTDIHPEYVEAHVRCTCGNEFTTRSTQPEIHVEICSNCHPFYTGKQKLVDTGGRVERFQRRAARRARGDKS